MLNSLQLTAQLPEIRLIATDIDGTLTNNHKFTPKLLQAIDSINAKGIELLLVTGRSAGWVGALNNYLPIAGAIAENGGVYFNSSGEYDLITPIESIDAHRQQLAEKFWELQARYPQIEESIDNQFRITDWTFDIAGLTDAELSEIAAQCNRWGDSFTFSTVQCHLKPRAQTKAAGILWVLNQYFDPEITPAQIVTVGDSPNDASMFDPQFFTHSVGVANIQHYATHIAHHPKYVTNSSEVAGFCELVDLLRNLRTPTSV